MQRQLGGRQAMTHDSTFGKILTNHKISGRLHTDETEIQVQDQTSSPACRRIGRDHSISALGSFPV